MAEYTEILPDGTRRVVKYNPHHDGPVSHRITLLNKVRFLKRFVEDHPWDYVAKKRLKTAQWKLSQSPKHFTQSRRPEATAGVL